MSQYADLEIELDRTDLESVNDFRIIMRFEDPDRDTIVNLLDQGPLAINLDQSQLLPFEGLSKSYGQELSNMLFAVPEVKEALNKARTYAAAMDTRLRVRLHIRSQAELLHNIHWETLSDPSDSQRTLLTNETILFSRFIESADFRRTESRPRNERKALIVVANPNNLEEFGYDRIKVDVELARTQASLGEGIATKTLASGGESTEDSDDKPTIDNIFAHLNKGFDILYLVAHGRLSSKAEPILVLEDEQGNVANVTGTELIQRLSDMWERPRLIVLASCETAGDGTVKSDEKTLAALGPRLAREGIAAVVAMQGKIKAQTAKIFMKAFFDELGRTKEIDTAIATARSMIRNDDDWWRPVLYMRSRTGRMSWYNTGFSKNKRFKWPTLIKSIKKVPAVCTPILGGELSEPLFGSRREIAQEWAKQHAFPLAPQNRDGLPQVAQYLDIDQDREFLLDEFLSYLCKAIWNRHEKYLRENPLSDLPKSTRDAIESMPDAIESMNVPQLVSFLNILIQIVWEQYRELNIYDPYRAFAKLDVPIYVTTGVSDLLTNALKREGKKPRVGYCPWNEFKEDEIEDSFQDDVLDYRGQVSYEPSKDEPLVYHLFGGLRNPNSLVLTEDDYFDYLIGVTENRNLIPDYVRLAMTNQSLLILGLPFDSWESRVLFRMLMGQRGNRWQNKTHVAAQIAPTEPQVLEAQRAQKYLEDYFGKGSISIFWGKPEDFVQQLQSYL